MIPSWKTQEYLFAEVTDMPVTFTLRDTSIYTFGISHGICPFLHVFAAWKTNDPSSASFFSSCFLKNQANQLNQSPNSKKKQNVKLWYTPFASSIAEELDLISVHSEFDLKPKESTMLSCIHAFGKRN